MAAGDFSASERFEIDRAIRAAEETSRHEFSVFVGVRDGGARDSPWAPRRAGGPSHSVLVMVDPVAHVSRSSRLVVKRTLTDHEVQLAVLEMQTAFAAGDLVGGLKRGITMLAHHARAPQTLHAEY